MPESGVRSVRRRLCGRKEETVPVPKEKGTKRYLLVGAAVAFSHQATEFYLSAGITDREIIFLTA